jgi:TolA-binding protein
MDCERFDRSVLDLLYDELDELTAAAARRHLDQCARCRGIMAGLRATREVGALPLVDPPDGLELRILEAERQMRGRLPLRQRAGRAVSVLAGYAMRPQLAMAALLFLVIGGGLVFFRGRPSAHDTVSVTERGVAESDPETVSVLPKGADPGAEAHGVSSAAPERKAATAAPSPPAAAPVALADKESSGDDLFQAAEQAFREHRYKEARQQFEGVVARGGTNAAKAALYAAQSVKSSDECVAAAPMFDQVSQRYPGTRAGYDAAWEAAACYETLGDHEKARRSYQALLDEPSYGTRARAALAQLDRVDVPVEVAARKAKAASRPLLQAEPQQSVGAGANAAPGDAAKPSEPEAAPKQAPAEVDARE